MLKSAKRRYNKYKDKMRVVDMDDVVKKYAENESPYFEGYKIKFHKNGSDYVVIADPSGYVRVLDLRTGTYVDVITGETLKGDEKDYQERTHFRIKRMNKMMEKITKPRALIVPKTLENRPYGWTWENPNIIIKYLTERQFCLLNEGMVFEDINDEIDTLIGGWEEEEISYEKLDGAIKVVERRIKKSKNKEFDEAANVLLEMLNLAKEKKTLLALYL